MRKRSNKKQTVLCILFSLAFLIAYSVFSCSATDHEPVKKKGTVLIANNPEDFIFINLGKDEIKVGDFVEVYRASDQIATASVRRTMKKMSEVSVEKKVIKIQTGDTVVVTKSWQRVPGGKPVADKIAKLKEKIFQLEDERSRLPLVSVDEKLEVLDEARSLATNTFKAQLTFLEESENGARRALDKKLEKLKEKKINTEKKLDTKITTLKHAKESVDKGLVMTKRSKDETISELEKKLVGLENAKKNTLEELKKEIKTLEKKKENIKTKVLQEPVFKKEMQLDELEEELRKRVVRYEMPEGLEGDTGELHTLEDCLTVAMQNHMPLKIAEKQSKLAQMRLFEAARKMGPTVTTKLELSDGQVSGRYYDGTKIQAEFKQPVFYGGELIFAVRQAKVNLEIVKNDHDRLKNDLALQVKKAYYSVDKAKKALDIQKNLRTKAKSAYDITKTSYDKGVISRVEYLKSGSQQNQADFQVSSAENDVSIANLILQQAMNVDMSVSIVPLAEPKIIQLGLSDCYELAYLNRPEIKIGRLSIEHYEFEKKIMEARAHWPRVDFLGMYGNIREDFEPYDTAEGANPRQLGPEYYVGTKVSLPLWGNTLGYSFTKEDWQPVVRTLQGTKSNTQEISFSFLDKLEDFSSLREAEIEYMRSQDDSDKKKQEITLEVKEAFFKYKKAIFLIDVSESKLDFQTRQVDVMDIRRELGEAKYSDVVEEMMKLAEERFGYLQAISDYYTAIASLNKAIGLDGHFEI